MAVRKIETEISLSNEQEFKRQLKAVNNSLAGMKSEMARVSAEYDGQANSAEALRKKQSVLQQQYDQQREKVEALEEMLEAAREQYDENSDIVLKYKKNLDYAQVALINFGRELEDTNKYLEEAEKSADGTAGSIDEFGKKVKEAGETGKESSGSLGGLFEALQNVQQAAATGDIGALSTSLQALGGVLAGAAVVKGLEEITSKMFELVDAANEYDGVMGRLEASSAAAGYTADETSELYEQLNGVLGDSQAAATTIANLQAIGLYQGDLKVLLDEVIGAWATYGDSIPIDGLAESINETIQVGKVTGVFADALNWAGVNEDYFNQQLSATAARSERAAIIMEQLRTQGLEATGQAWQENNQSMITYNQTQDKITQKTAEFGRTLRPVAQTLQEVKLGLINLGQDFWDNLSSFGKRALAARDQSKISGSHADGLDYVPYDGYVAELHRGEAVLTSNEADALRGLRRSGSMLGGGGAVSAAPAVQSATAQPAVYDLTIPVELTIDGATFARKEYKYRIAEDARRGSPLTGKGGR